MLKFPIHVKRAGETPPDSRLYYEAASNGLFRVRDTGMFRAVTRVDDVPGLLPEREHVRLRFPRMPASLVGQAVAFFREVYRRHGGEGVLLVFYDPARERFALRPPTQWIDGYHDGQGRWRALHRISYGTAQRPEGMLRFGSLHSHADLPAYASHLDCEDEQFDDGLHGVFGDLHQVEPSLSACFVSGGVRFPLAPKDVLEPAEEPEPAARPDWLATVVRRDTTSRSAVPSFGPRGGTA